MSVGIAVGIAGKPRPSNAAEFPCAYMYLLQRLEHAVEHDADRLEHRPAILAGPCHRGARGVPTEHDVRGGVEPDVEVAVRA